MREAHWLEVSGFAGFVSPGTQGSQGEPGDEPGPLSRENPCGAPALWTGQGWRPGGELEGRSGWGLL